MRKPFAMALMVALGAPATLARAAPPACSGTLSGSVTGKFDCQVSVTDGEGERSSWSSRRRAIDGIPSLRPGSLRGAGLLAPGTYTLDDLGMGKASVAAEGGTLYTATRTTNQRGEVTLVLLDGRKDARERGAFVVHGTYRARLIPAGDGKKGEVIVEVAFRDGTKLLFAAGGILLVGGASIAVLLSPEVTAAMPRCPGRRRRLPSAPAAPSRRRPRSGRGRAAVASSSPPPVRCRPTRPRHRPPGRFLGGRAPGRATGSPGAPRRRPRPQLNELQPRAVACFDEETQAQHGQYPVSRDPRRPLQGWTSAADDPPSQPGDPAGPVRIVDAPVESQGAACDGLVACAQRILRGHVLSRRRRRPPGGAGCFFPLRQ